MCSLAPQQAGRESDIHGQMTNVPMTSNFIAHTEVAGGEGEQETKAVVDKVGKSDKWQGQEE